LKFGVTDCQTRFIHWGKSFALEYGSFEVHEEDRLLPVPKRKTPWKQRQRRLLVVLALLAGLGCAGILGLQWTAYRARQATAGIIATLAEQGLYVEAALGEGVAQAAKIPAVEAKGKDSAEQSEEIPFHSFGLQAEASADISEYTECVCSRELPAWESMSEAMRVAMRKYLADNQDTLGRLHDNSLRWQTALSWRTPVGGREESARWFGTLSKAIRLLQIEAHVALADFDGETAAAALDAVLVLVKQSARIPSVSRTYWQEHFASSMACSVRDVIASGAMKSEHLWGLQQGFSSFRIDGNLRGELPNQLKWSLALFDKPERIQDYYRTPVDRFVPGFDRLLVSATQRSGWYEIQRSQYLRNIHELAAIVDRPAPERFQLLKGMINEATQRPQFLTGFSSSLTWHAMIILREDAQGRKQLAFAATGLAVERYRLEHGSLPDTLEVLAPNYMAEIPRDPFNDGPLLYHRHNDGFTVTSNGLNGVPTMGSDENDRESEWNWYANTDMPFRVQYRQNAADTAADPEVQPEPPAAEKR
jgi:hypothetical protein